MSFPILLLVSTLASIHGVQADPGELRLVNRSVVSNPGPADYADAIASDGQGGIYILGQIWGESPADWGRALDPTSRADLFLMKYDASGRRLWVQRFGSAFDDYPVAMSVTPSGNVVVLSSREESEGGRLTRIAILLAQFDPSGGRVWERVENTYTRHPTAMITTASGELLLFGIKNNPGKVPNRSAYRQTRRIEDGAEIDTQEVSAGPGRNWTRISRAVQSAEGDFYLAGDLHLEEGDLQVGFVQRLGGEGSGWFKRIAPDFGPLGVSGLVVRGDAVYVSAYAPGPIFGSESPRARSRNLIAQYSAATGQWIQGRAFENGTNEFLGTQLLATDSGLFIVSSELVRSPCRHLRMVGHPVIEKIAFEGLNLVHRLSLTSERPDTLTTAGVSLADGSLFIVGRREVEAPNHGPVEKDLVLIQATDRAAGDPAAESTDK